MEHLIDQIKPEIKEILRKSLDSDEISIDDALKLLKVTGREFIALQNVADIICRQKKKDIVTFVMNRNINFTNICYQGCKFCSFSVPETHEDAFLLSLNEIKERTIEAKANDCTEICMQGGINLAVDFGYYFDILKTVKEVDRRIHIHAFSPQEIFHVSELSGESIEDTLRDLRNAGLDSIPGTAAEILVDEVREIICPNKINVKQWVEIISTAHELDIPTTSTMMYGHIETLEDRVKHMEVLRIIQKNTGGFTEFVPLSFIRKKPVLARLKEYPLNPNYGMADLKLYSVARLFFNNLIENIQCSWVKLGPKFAQVSLNYGVNDFSGTLMEESISKSAGADFGEYLSSEEIISIIKAAGKHPAQRDTIYNIIKKY